MAQCKECQDTPSLELYKAINAIPTGEGTNLAKQTNIRLTERHLQALWWEQIHFLQPLKVEGRTLEVLSPGHWNESAGPDFRHAHLVIGGVEVRGDIEIHIRDDGWHCHGHDRDPAYNQVILHIALWDVGHLKPLVRADGHPIPCLYLYYQLKWPLERLLNMIDLDLYPYRPHLGAGRCSHALFQKLAPQELSAFFEGAALHRLQQKRKRYTSLSEAIAVTLGFPDNALIFSHLFRWLEGHPGPVSLIHALCMGACGYFRERFQSLWGKSLKYRELYILWRAGSPAFHEIPTLSLPQQQVRPLHHPVRRFAALALLLAEGSGKTRLEAIRMAWRTFSRETPTIKRCRALYKELISLLPHYSDPYWDWHYLFEENPLSSPIALLGANIKNEMLTNAILPALYAEIGTSPYPSEQLAFLQFFRSLTSTSHSKGLYLQHRFLGDSSQASLFRRTITVQGALQLHGDFCKHYETSCHGCPFIDRVQGARNN